MRSPFKSELPCIRKELARPDREGAVSCAGSSVALQGRPQVCGAAWEWGEALAALTF